MGRGPGAEPRAPASRLRAPGVRRHLEWKGGLRRPQVSEGPARRTPLRGIPGSRRGIPASHRGIPASHRAATRPPGPPGTDGGGGRVGMRASCAPRVRSGGSALPCRCGGWGAGCWVWVLGTQEPAGNKVLRPSAPWAVRWRRSALHRSS